MLMDGRLFAGVIVLYLALSSARLCISGPEHRAPPSDSLALTARVIQPGSVRSYTPRLSVSIKNSGSKPVSLVLPRDGSDYGWRTPVIGISKIEVWQEPHIYYEESPPVRPKAPRHPTKPPLETMMRCGNYADLMRSDIFILAPGQSQQLFERDFHGEKGSNWRLLAYYVNDPDMTWVNSSCVMEERGARALLKKTVKCSLRSNEVRFSF